MTMTLSGTGPDLNFDQFPADVVEFRDTVRAFAQEVVAPRALELDLEAHDAFAWDLVQQGTNSVSRAPCSPASKAASASAWSGHAWPWRNSRQPAPGWR